MGASFCLSYGVAEPVEGPERQASGVLVAAFCDLHTLALSFDRYRTTWYDFAMRGDF